MSAMTVSRTYSGKISTQLKMHVLFYDFYIVIQQYYSNYKYGMLFSYN